MSRVRTYSASAALAVEARSRSLEDLARTAPVPGRAVWRRTERDLQVVEEESVVFSNIEVRVKRAGPSGLGDLEVTEYIARIRLPSLFYCTSHMLTVFITSNQIPLHVHAVFSHYFTCTLYTSGARHDAHAYS